MDMEKAYRDIDFSRFSRVKESLRSRLHRERGDRRLSLEELDLVAAAGPGYAPHGRNLRQD